MLPFFYACLVSVTTTLLGIYSLNYTTNNGILSYRIPWLIETTPIVPAPTVTAIRTKMVTVSVYPEETLVAIPTSSPTPIDTGIFASTFARIESCLAEVPAIHKLFGILALIIVSFFAGHAFALRGINKMDSGESIAQHAPNTPSLRYSEEKPVEVVVYVPEEHLAEQRAQTPVLSYGGFPEQQGGLLTYAPMPTHDSLQEQQDAVTIPTPSPELTHEIFPEQQQTLMTLALSPISEALLGQQGAVVQTPSTSIHDSHPEQQETLMTPAPTHDTFPEQQDAVVPIPFTPIRFSLPEQQKTTMTPAPTHDTVPEQQGAVLEMPSTPVQDSHPEQQETVMPPAPTHDTFPGQQDAVVPIPFAPIHFFLPEQQETIMRPAPSPTDGVAQIPSTPIENSRPEQQETLTPALPPVPQNLPQQQDTIMISAPDSQLDPETLQEQLETQQLERNLEAALDKFIPEGMELDEPAPSAESKEDMSIDELAPSSEIEEDMETDEAPAQPIDDVEESMDTDEPMPNAAPTLPEHEGTNMTPAPSPTEVPGPVPEQEEVDLTPAPNPSHLPEQQPTINSPTAIPGQIAAFPAFGTLVIPHLPSPPEPAHHPSAPMDFELEQAALQREKELKQTPANDSENEPDLSEAVEPEPKNPSCDGLFKLPKAFYEMMEKRKEKEALKARGSDKNARKRGASDDSPREESDQRESKRNETQEAHEKRPNFSMGLLELHHQLFPGTKMPEVKAESTTSAASAAAKSTPSSKSTEKSAESSASLPTPATTPASSPPEPSPPEPSEPPTTPSPTTPKPPPTNTPTTPLPSTASNPPRAKASPLTSDDLAELTSIKTRMTGKHLQSLERILVSNSRLWTRDPTGRIEYDITAQTAITQQRLFKFACKIRDENGLESPAAARRAESTFARAGASDEASHAEYRADVQSGKPKARAEENEKNEKPTIGRGGGPSASDIADPHAPSLVDIYGIKKALCGFRGEQKARLAQLVQRQGIDCDVKSNLADLESFPARVQRLVLGFVLGEVQRDEERVRKAREEEERRVREEEERKAMDEGDSDDENEGEGEDEDDGEDVEDSLEEDEFGEAWRREQVFEDLGREFGSGEAAKAKAKARDEMEMEAEVEWRPKPSRFNRKLREMREALGRM